MNRSSFAFSACCAAFVMAGCSVSGTITVKPQTKYVGSNAVTKTSTATFKPTDVIEIENGNGDVVVTAGAVDKISVSTKVFAFADSDQKADGDAAIADVTSTIAIDESTGKFYVHCNEAKSSHGSAKSGTSGCDGFTVTIPAGSAAAGVAIKATAHNGNVSATGIFAGASAIVHSDNGDAVASLSPTPGTIIEVSSGNGDVTLSVPSDFTADLVTLTSAGAVPKVVNTDFPDVSDQASLHRKPGGAKSITVKSDNGTVTLKKQ